MLWKNVRNLQKYYRHDYRQTRDENARSGAHSKIPHGRIFYIAASVQWAILRGHKILSRTPNYRILCSGVFIFFVIEQRRDSMMCRFVLVAMLAMLMASIKDIASQKRVRGKRTLGSPSYARQCKHWYHDNPTTATQLVSICKQLLTVVQL